MTERIDFERSDVAPSLIAKLAIGLAVFVIAIPLLISVIYPQTGKPMPLKPPHIAAGAAVLAVTPRADLAQFEKIDAADLDRYGWIDRDHDVVQIPIERAMALLAQRGLPGWPKASPGKERPQ